MSEVKRMDSADDSRQVKVRGFRIELGEIESALQEDQSVKESLVTTQDCNDAKRIVAYVALKPGLSTTVTQLRNHLQQYLPEYMIPGAFVFLSELPRTSSGRIDVRALPLPESGRPPLDSVYVTPRNDVEVAVARIWEDVLGVGNVGVYDPFVQLGGDSITAARIVVRIEEEFGLRLRIGFVLDSGTVAIVAEKIAQHAEHS
jgi:acyl carrier protein